MISVCLALHNGEKYVKEQISSILSQLTENDELIISDDGSTDNSLDIVKTFNDSRLRLIHCSQDIELNNNPRRNFYYASNNFINAINNAKGDYIFLSDQDDIWYPNKIKICIEALKINDVVKHNYTKIDSHGVVLQDHVYNRDKYYNLTLFKCLFNLPFRGCCLAFRREVIDYCRPFPKKCLQHDTWIGIIALTYKLRFGFINEDLIYHRIHENNVSELSTPNSLMYKISYRLRLMYDIFKHRYRKKN